MIPEFGHFALILSLFVVLIQGVMPLVGAHRNRRQWIALARPATAGVFLLIATSFVCLGWSFYVNDFSVLYVARHSNTQLPTIYRLAAVWGRPRRIAFALAADARRLGTGGCVVLASPARSDGGTRVGRAWPSHRSACWLSCC